jgi:hypothetical protein
MGLLLLVNDALAPLKVCLYTEIGLFDLFFGKHSRVTAQSDVTLLKYVGPV